MAATGRDGEEGKALVGKTLGRPPAWQQSLVVRGPEC